MRIDDSQHSLFKRQKYKQYNVFIYYWHKLLFKAGKYLLIVSSIVGSRRYSPKGMWKSE